MLKSVDILIGFTVIMLVISIAVTMVNQMIISTLNLRGSQLRDGVCRLLRYIDHGIDPKYARILANLVLKDPIVATRRVIGGFRLATVVQREELTVLLMRIAAGDAAELDMEHVPETDEKNLSLEAQLKKIETKINELELQRAKESKGLRGPVLWLWNRLRGEASPIEKKIAVLKLRKSIGENGLPHLHDTLKAVRNKILELELSTPAQSTSARTNHAILTCARSDFVARLNSWFDQTMDRVSEAFSTGSLFWTLVASLVIAGVLQLDALSILNRLGVDDSFRSSLIAEVSKNPGLVKQITGNESVDAVQAKADAAEKSEEGIEGQAKKGDPKARASLQQARDQTDKARAAVSEEKAARDAMSDVLSLNQIIQLPNYAEYAGFRDYWTRIKTEWPGVLLSAALLSLGGPFWYEMLKNLLKLRSVLATKDDENRKERQSNQPEAMPT